MTICYNSNVSDGLLSNTNNEEPPEGEPTKDTQDLRLKSNPTFIDYYIYTLVLHGLGLILNSITIVVVARFKPLNRPHKLIVLLAFSDIAVCLMTPFNIIRGHIAWTYDQFIIACMSFMIYWESSLSISVYVYLIITIDRFVALIFPLKHTNIMTRAKFVWYAVILSVHHIVFYSMFYGFINNKEPWVQDQLDNRLCLAVNWVHLHGRYYGTAFICLLLLINIILCVILAIHLMATRKKRHALTTSRGVDNLSKATTTIVLVCCIYAVLYAQNISVSLARIGDDSERAVLIQEISDYFFLINHFLNPIVYYSRMSDFRKGVHQLFCRKGNKSRENSLKGRHGRQWPSLKTVSENLQVSVTSSMTQTTTDVSP